MKESILGSKLKGWAADPEGARPDGRWPVALLLTQPKQSQNPCFGYTTHAALDMFQLVAQFVLCTRSQEHAHRDNRAVEDGCQRLPGNEVIHQKKFNKTLRPFFVVVVLFCFVQEEVQDNVNKTKMCDKINCSGSTLKQMMNL